MIEPNLTKFFMLALGIVFLVGAFVGCIDPKRKEWIGTSIAGLVMLTVASALIYGF